MDESVRAFVDKRRLHGETTRAREFWDDEKWIRARISNYMDELVKLNAKLMKADRQIDIDFISGSIDHKIDKIEYCNKRLEGLRKVAKGER